MPYELPPHEFFPPHHRRGLFYSDAWQEAWLAAYGEHPDIQIHPEAGVYTYRQRLKRILPIRSASLIGATSPATRSIRAEYTCLTEEALHASLKASWDQLVLPDVLVGSEDEKRIHRFAKSNNLTLRQTEPEPVYAVDLRNGTFNDYLAALGKNTRLRLYNRRKRLEQKGKVTIENLWPDRERFYSILNEFHQQRWGRPCYTGRNKALIDALLTRFDDQKMSVDMSVMNVASEPASAVLDIQTGGRLYNLQSGFSTSEHPGLSLGTLHLGYQLEAAFATSREVYDFMAGAGKATQYKHHLATHVAAFTAFRLVKSPVLKLLYRFK
ncbi:GNAT family N-acetyltransferase [Marinimicrobium locisalis]|uniref:GNAT family N-acetyltransferase n=1 Tax=Marinimicrobium locisalis TaxID=546022 RepID=UPI003221883A